METSLSRIAHFNILEDAGACGVGKNSVHQDLMSEEIILAFSSLHQYFYKFSTLNSYENGYGCSDCCMDSSFSFPRRIEDRCTSYLLAWELPPYCSSGEILLDYEDENFSTWL